MHKVLLKSQNLIVRPISQEEISRWNHLMTQHHYLGFESIMGEQIKYVALLDNNWVALLGWGSASLKCSDRDKYIGWNTYNTMPRLKYISNNSRFLILPEVRVRNLASRILALNLNRLSNDWQLKYDHPILLVETFVNPEKFTGACYKANNWILIGKSKGFRKDHAGYHYHGCEKYIFIKPLTSKATIKLKGLRGEMPMADIDRLPILGESGLFELTKTIPDGRNPSGLRHRSPGLLTLSVLAILSGAKGYKDISIWCKSVSEPMLNNLWLRIVPSESTIRRYLMKLDANTVDQIITKWLLQHIDIYNEQIAMDGKVLRGSHDGIVTAVKLVAAVVVGKGIILAQKEIPAETNEIPMVQEMIKSLPFENQEITVSTDALHSQNRTSDIILQKKSDAIFTIKDNQKSYKNQIIAAFSTESAFSPSGT